MPLVLCHFCNHRKVFLLQFPFDVAYHLFLIDYNVSSSTKNHYESGSRLVSFIKSIVSIINFSL